MIPYRTRMNLNSDLDALKTKYIEGLSPHEPEEYFNNL